MDISGWLPPVGESIGPTITDASTGAVDDVATTVSGDPAGTIRFTGAGVTATGFASGAARRRLLVMAVGGPVTLAHEDASSAAANRIETSTGADVVLPAGASLLLAYDDASARWRMIGVLGGSPLGWYNPKDYGATLDGVHDDLPALNAMLADMPDEGGYIHFPPGRAWLSDVWKVAKPVVFVGIGGTGFGYSCFEVAAGRPAIYFDENDDTLTTGSSRSVVDRLEVRTRALIHPTANGSTFGRAVSVWSSGGTARKGEVFVASGGASPTRCFRVTSTGMSDPNDAGTFAASEPTWNTSLGATTTTNGMTLVCESLMAVHQTLHAYVVGDRVWAPNDHRYIFECEAAGTSAVARPNELKGGDDVVGVQVHGTVTDGGVTWRVKLACGVYINSDLGKFGVIHASNFVGASVHIQGGSGQDARFMTYADNVRVREVISEYCGLGAFVGGSDANGWTIGGLFVINAGTLYPTPADAYGANGLGGHALVDRSDAGGRVNDLYAQTSTGRPVLKTGNGRALIESSFTELYRLALASGGYTLAIGGTLGEYSAWEAASNVTCVSASGSRQIYSVDPQSANTIRAYLDLQDGYTVHAVSSDDEHGNFLGLKYRYNQLPRGWWSYVFGNQNAKTAYAISGAYASPDPGPGWFLLPDGYLLGNPQDVTSLFDGHTSELTSKRLRGGARKKGDRFRNQNTTISLTSDGYRGVAWQASTAYVAAYANWGVQASAVEPTTNTGRRSGGEQVWKCTTEGVSGGSEPAWPGSPTAGVTTVSDGSCVWTYLGTTPSYDVEQVTGKTRLPVRTVETQTTTASASQVIVDGASSDGHDLALPDNAVALVTDLVILHKPGTAHGGTIEVKSRWVRNGGAPAQLGSTTITYDLTGSTLDGTTVAHVVNGNRIELQASPESAETLNWRVFRTQSEGVD